MTATTEANFRLEHDPWGRLVFVDSTGQYPGAQPVRMFPLSDPDGWISICDGQGRELACVKDPSLLPEDVRRTLDEELARLDFVPVIERITSVSTATEPSEWKVETDRGATAFLLNGAEEVRRLGPHGGMIVDLQGIRYVIRDTRALDDVSRHILERYL